MSGTAADENVQGTGAVDGTGQPGVVLERQTSADSAALTVQVARAEMQSLLEEVQEVRSTLADAQRRFTETLAQAGRELAETRERFRQDLEAVQRSLHAAPTPPEETPSETGGQPAATVGAAEQQAGHSEAASPAAATPTSAAALEQVIRDALRASDGGKSGTPKPKEPPKFSGDPRKLREWKVDMEFYLAHYPRLTDQQKAVAVGDALETDSVARKAFRHLLAEVGVDGLTYAGVMNMLQKRFGCVTEEMDALTLMENAVQGSRSVVGWEQRLREIAAMQGMQAYRYDEGLLVRKFVKGLRPEIGKELVRDKFTSLLEASEAAQQIEQHLRLRTTSLPRGRPFRGKKARALAAALEAVYGGESDGEAEDAEGGEGDPDSTQLAALRAPKPTGKKGGSGGRGNAGSSDGKVVVKGTDGKVVAHIRCHNCHNYGHRKRVCPHASTQEN